VSVARVEPEGDAPAGLVEHDLLGPDRPLHREELAFDAEARLRATACSIRASEPPCGFKCARAIRGLPHDRVAVGLQPAPRPHAEARVVVDDQDRAGHTPIIGRCGRGTMRCAAK
jgi:hypothetical protein